MDDKIIIIAGALLVAHLYCRKQRNNALPSVKYVDRVPGNYNALAIPPFGILISKKEQNNERLLNHELTHWNQFQRMGLIPFYAAYIKDFVSIGYDKHPMEIEARKAAGETDYCTLNYSECIRTGSAKTTYNPQFRL